MTDLLYKPQALNVTKCLLYSIVVTPHKYPVIFIVGLYRRRDSEVCQWPMGLLTPSRFVICLLLLELNKIFPT